jgi:hypothetical protein
MNREERTVFLGVLTPIVFGSWIFFDKGSFIFPFPLNELLFFSITLQFLIWNIKIDKFKYSMFFLTALFGLLSSDFFWTLFFDGESYEQIMLGPLTDVFKLIHLLGIGVCLTLEIQTNLRYKLLLSICISAILLLGVITSNQIPILISITFTLVFSLSKRPFAPTFLLLGLYGILEVGKLLMLQLI